MAQTEPEHKYHTTTKILKVLNEVLPLLNAFLDQPTTSNKKKKENVSGKKHF